MRKSLKWRNENGHGDAGADGWPGWLRRSGVRIVVTTELGDRIWPKHFCYHAGKHPGSTVVARRGCSVALVKYIEACAKPGVLCIHPPNGGKRNLREALKLKRMGAKAGASDLLFWHDDKSFALELKAEGGRVSEAQLDFIARFERAGGYAAIAHGLDEAIRVLKAWSLVR